MIDLALTQNLDVKFSEGGVPLLLEGRDAYNQAIALGTIAFYQDVIGSLDKEEALDSLQEGARDVASDFPEYVQEVQSIEAEYEDEQKTTARVTVTYIRGEEFAFPVS